MSYNLLVLPGDGIGPEVMRETLRVVKWFEEHRGLKFEITEGLVGGASIDAHGVPLTQETIDLALASDAVLFGAVGGPQYDAQPFSNRPEIGILGLRGALKLFANLRPATVLDALVDASPLKPELVRGLDIMIVRESTGGIYFGEPRGIETLPNGEQRGYNTEVYTTSEIERVTRVACDIAMKRSKRLCSVEKANVMDAGLLWRQVVTKLVAREYPEITLTHMYADNCAMQLARNPKQFDVIVTSNLFGDLLSDLASMLTGSLGMLPSATLSAVREDGKRHALYEPIHGSAPDIAGKGLANPMAQMLSCAMLLRYSLGLEAEARLVEDAVAGVLAQGLATADLQLPGAKRISTTECGDAILAYLNSRGH